MKALELPLLDAEHHDELDTLYRTTHDVRLRTRAQMILLASEQQLTVPAIAAIVRESDETVRRWLKRYQADGVAGLSDTHRGGAPAKVTDDYREHLLFAVRRRPRSLDLPFSLWTLQRLADYLAEVTGIRGKMRPFGCISRQPALCSAVPNTPSAAQIRNTPSKKDD